MFKRKWLVPATALLLSVGAVQAEAAKTLIYCSEGSPEGFDPARYTSGTTFDASAETVYNRLVQFKRGSTEVEPGLAKSWDISDDGLTYTFHLRDGVKFQKTSFFKPSRDFNADDVVFTFDRMLNPDNKFTQAAHADYPYFIDMGLRDNIASVTKVDPHTVQIKLNHVDAAFVADLAMSFASVVSKEYADTLMKEGKPEQFNTMPVGTGPFTFLRYQKDAQIRYRANPDYWKGKQKIDNLIFAITKDSAIRAQKLKAGECQVSVYPTPTEVKGLEKDPNLKVLKQNGLNVGYVAFNVKKKPFDNQKVRQALNYAVNKKAMIEAVYQGAAEVAKNPIPPTMWSYNDDVKDYPYDPQKAKQLLKEAGYGDGFKTDLWALPVQRPYMLNGRKAAEMIQADWAKVGVKADIVTYEWGEYLKRSKAGDHQTLMLGWTGDNGDPDNFLGTLLSCDAVQGGNNRAFWCNKEFSNLTTEAKRTTDKAERTKLYKQAQVIFKEQAPWITLAHSVVFQPMSKRVKDFKMSPFGLNSFYGVDIE